MRTTDEVEVYRVHGGSAPGRRVRRASARTRRARAPGSSPGEPATGASSRCARPRARWQWRPGCIPTGISPRPVRPEEEGRRDCERAAGTRSGGRPPQHRRQRGTLYLVYVYLHVSLDVGRDESADSSVGLGQCGEPAGQCRSKSDDISAYSKGAS